MELTDTKTVKKDEDDTDDRKSNSDDQPTTSRDDNFNPVKNSNNMNDLKALEFNSADEIRQAMKAILSGNISQHAYEEGDCKSPKATKRSAIHSPVGDRLRRPKEGKPKIDTVKVSPNQKKVNRKRPGRPPLPGPSKKIRRVTVTDMYLGKLSNVVPFKHKGKSDFGSESDVESVYIFY